MSCLQKRRILTHSNQIGEPASESTAAIQREEEKRRRKSLHLYSLILRNPISTWSFSFEQDRPTIFHHEIFFWTQSYSQCLPDCPFSGFPFLGIDLSGCAFMCKWGIFSKGHYWSTARCRPDITGNSFSLFLSLLGAISRKWGAWQIRILYGTMFFFLFLDFSNDSS